MTAQTDTREARAAPIDRQQSLSKKIDVQPRMIMVAEAVFATRPVRFARTSGA
jgi:hypothetical protein